MDGSFGTVFRLARLTPTLPTTQLARLVPAYHSCTLTAAVRNAPPLTVNNFTCKHITTTAPWALVRAFAGYCLTNVPFFCCCTVSTGAPSGTWAMQRGARRRSSVASIPFMASCAPAKSTSCQRPKTATLTFTMYSTCLLFCRRRGCANPEVNVQRSVLDDSWHVRPMRGLRCVGLQQPTRWCTRCVACLL